MSQVFWKSCHAARRRLQLVEQIKSKAPQLCSLFGILLMDKKGITVTQGGQQTWQSDRQCNAVNESLPKETGAWLAIYNKTSARLDWVRWHAAEYSAKIIKREELWEKAEWRSFCCSVQQEISITWTHWPSLEFEGKSLLANAICWDVIESFLYFPLCIYVFVFICRTFPFLSRWGK